MVRGVLPLVFSSGRLHSRRRTQTDRICTSRLNTSISGGDAVSPSASCLVRLLELMARYPVKVIKTVPAVEEINKRVKQRLMRISNTDCSTEIKPKREKKSTSFSNFTGVPTRWKFDYEVAFFPQFPLGPLFAGAPQTSAKIIPSASSKLTAETHKVSQVHRAGQTGGLLSSISMISLTMIARVADGLPLAASIQEDEQVSMEASFPM